MELRDLGDPGFLAAHAPRFVAHPCYGAATLMRSRMLFVALLVVGCARKKAAAPATASSVDLAGKHAPYKDWKSADACAADAMVHWSDFEAWKGLLTDFLAQTSMGADGVWTSEQIATLETATQTLGPGLDGVDSQVSGVGKCKNYPKSSGVEDGAKEVAALSEQARKRLADAPALLPVLKEKVELNKWKAAQADAIKTGKESWCGAKPSADVYYGATDETGTTEWLFCDDTKVKQAEGAKPEVHVEAGKKPPRNAKQYVEAALKYPASELQKAPKPGEKAASGETAEKKPEGGCRGFTRCFVVTAGDRDGAGDVHRSRVPFAGSAVRPRPRPRPRLSQ